MSLCPMTLKAIGGALGTEVLYLCKVLHLVDDEVDYYVCVGEKAFYFINERFEFVKGKSQYIHLQRIIVDQHIDTILQIHLSEHKDRNMPLKMNFICFDRRMLVYYLNYAWKTNLMYNQLEVKDLPVYQYKIPIQDKPNRIAIGPPEFMFHTRSDNPNFQDEKFVINGYVFQMNAQFQNKQTGVYSYKQNNVEYQQFIQVTNPLPIQTISKMGLHASLEQYAIQYIQNIVSEYSIKKYYIDNSNFYYRRHNLTEDKSQWRGWEINITTSSPKIKQISVIILRRMFLPPLLENFNDIILVLFSNNHAVNLKKGKIELRQVADSLYALNMNLPTYNLLIEGKCNALTLDEANYEYLMRHNPPVYPSAIRQAFIIIKYIYNKLSLNSKKIRIKEEQINQKMAKFNINYQDKELNYTYKNLTEVIKYVQQCIQENFQFDDRDKKFMDSVQDQVVEEPSRRNRQNSEDNSMERNSANIIAKQIMNFSLTTYNWRKKVSRFITFCIDGGIFGDRFTLVDVIDGILDSQSKRDCQELLEYCLFMFSEEGELIFTGITKQIEKSIQNLNNFNERVMIQLIKNHYFYNFYIEQDVSSSNVYQQLMIYFLMEHNSIEIKKAVCFSLIDKLQKKPDEQSLPSHANQVLNELVIPLMYIYARSEDISLQVYACIALQNILVSVSEAKQTMVQNNCIDVIYEKLESPHQKLVNYSLKFIHNLYDGMNSSQIFNMTTLQEKILEIVIGYKGMNFTYNIEVICSALSLIRKLLASKENDFIKFREQFDKFFKLISPSINKVEGQVDDFYFDQELQEETLGVITLIASIDKDIKHNIASKNGKYHGILKYCIDLILNLVSDILLDRSITLLITLCQDRDDLVQYLKSQNLLYSAIKFIRFDSKPAILPNSSIGQKLNVCLWLLGPTQEVEDDPKIDPKLLKIKK